MKNPLGKGTKKILWNINQNKRVVPKTTRMVYKIEVISLRSLTIKLRTLKHIVLVTTNPRTGIIHIQTIVPIIEKIINFLFSSRDIFLSSGESQLFASSAIERVIKITRTTFGKRIPY